MSGNLRRRNKKYFKNPTNNRYENEVELIHIVLGGLLYGLLLNLKLLCKILTLVQKIHSKKLFKAVLSKSEKTILKLNRNF